MVYSKEYLLPHESARYQFVERQFFDCAALCGFSEIRFPPADGGPRKALAEKDLLNGPLPLKLACLLNPFQENSGLELLTAGAEPAAAEAEIISFISDFFARLGLAEIQLLLNSACSLDCGGLKRYLDTLQLDCTETDMPDEPACAFSFVSEKAVICRGGQLDGSFAADKPAVSAVIDENALLQLLDAQGAELPQPPSCDLYIGADGGDNALSAMAMAADLRGEGFFAQSDLMGRELSGQLAHAGLIGAKFWTTLDEQAQKSGSVLVKNLATGETVEVMLDSDALSRFLYDVEINKITDSLDASNLQQMMEGLSF